MSKYVVIAEDLEYPEDDMRWLQYFSLYGSYEAAKRSYDIVSAKLATVSDHFSVRILDMLTVRQALADLPHLHLDLDEDGVVIW